MEFNSQICTTREQSERLLSLGLKKETADMYWTKPFNEWFPIVKRGNEKIDDENIPAWSLHRLWELDLIHDITLDSGDEIATLYDEVINNIEAQIKEGYFNKEYLV